MKTEHYDPFQEVVNYQMSDSGAWDPMIPYPVFVMHWLFWYRIRCQCGLKFSNIHDYQAHFKNAVAEEKWYNDKLEGAK